MAKATRSGGRKRKVRAKKLKEGEEVHYRVFNDKIDSIGIACDV